MPTGYTATLYEGKPQTFRQFAMQCARAFGATITMRDADLDAEIPEKFEISDYHLKGLFTAQDELRTVQTASIDALNELARLEYDDALRVWQRMMKERRERKDRYEAMLNEVNEWTPPTDEHAEFKKFMQSQLIESIDFDCNYDLPMPVQLSGEQWKYKEIARLKRDIEYHKQEQKEEELRVQGRNEWIAALRKSLPKGE